MIPAWRNPEGWLLGWLGMLVILPSWLVLFGLEDGKIIFVLYREPKLVALSVLGWCFLAAWFWVFRGRWPMPALAATLRRPAIIACGLLVLYLCLSASWAVVRANAIYELQQWILLLPLAVVLVAWGAVDARVPDRVRHALCLSAIGITGVGILQAAGALPWLPVINPFGEVAQPSLMGYKNPAALMILGQIFLLLETVLRPRRQLHWRWRSVLCLLLVVELGYMLSLQSRASLAGLAAGTALLAASWVMLRRTWKSFGTVLAGLVLLAVVAAAAMAWNPSLRVKVGSAASLLSEPASYLETDRGVFLRNTFEMVREHPLGVGVGDWQTHYPVFRAHGRDVAFTSEYQVRRAHSDMVQMLGEGGWPGLMMWLAVLATAVAAPIRAAWVGNSYGALFVAAQLTAMFVAMSLDYVSELPYLKLQLVLLLVLAMTSSMPRMAASVLHRERRLTLAVALVLTVVAAVQSAASVVTLRKVMAAAEVGYTHQVAMASGDPNRLNRQALERCASLGKALVRGPGHTKTLFRDLLLSANACHLLGWDEPSLALLSRSLELAPYHPNALQLAAVVVDDPKLKTQWRRAANHVMHEATSGFELPYPSLPHELEKSSR